jgi:hypothetical protein
MNFLRGDSDYCSHFYIRTAEPTWTSISPLFQTFQKDDIFFAFLHLQISPEIFDGPLKAILHLKDNHIFLVFMLPNQKRVIARPEKTLYLILDCRGIMLGCSKFYLHIIISLSSLSSRVSLLLTSLLYTMLCTLSRVLRRVFGHREKWMKTIARNKKRVAFVWLTLFLFLAIVFFLS